MAVPAWWMSTSPEEIWSPFCMTSPSSEMDRFSMLILGKSARSSKERLVSLLEPVTCIVFWMFLVEGAESWSLNVLWFDSNFKTRKNSPNVPFGTQLYLSFLLF